jgi:carbamate kinase
LEAKYLKRILIALGGNAILKSKERGTVEEMRKNIKEACRQLVPIIASWYQVVITHGNGPQVGNILIQNEKAREEVPAMTLDVCGAQSQGQLGYLLQQVLSNEIKNLGKEAEVASVVTQTVVSADDPAFASPTKPIGPWLKEPGPPEHRYLHDPQRGWRRLVPSPQPLAIANHKTIEALLRSGIVVIACGGGGVPVVNEKGTGLKGQEAVIDKDLASQCLANALGAHILLILTDVPAVYLDFGTPQQKPIDQIDLPAMKNLLRQGKFPAGSIGPKVEAAIRFVEQGGEKAIIASMDRAEDALKGKSGTLIYKP